MGQYGRPSLATAGLPVAVHVEKH